MFSRLVNEALSSDGQRWANKFDHFISRNEFKNFRDAFDAFADEFPFLNHGKSSHMEDYEKIFREIWEDRER